MGMTTKLQGLLRVPTNTPQPHLQQVAVLLRDVETAADVQRW